MSASIRDMAAKKNDFKWMTPACVILEETLQRRHDFKRDRHKHKTKFISATDRAECVLEKG